MSEFDTIQMDEVPHGLAKGGGRNRSPLTAALAALTPAQAIRVPFNGRTAKATQILVHGAANTARVSIATARDGEFIYVWLKDKAAS